MILRSPSPCHPSPIQKLPVELLSYIFNLGAHNVDVEDESLPDIDAETIKIPLAFSRVNRHWRNVALKTPSLWTSICVTAALVNSGGGQGCSSETTRFNAKHLETYLALSRNYPLDILVDARDQDWDFSEPEMHAEDEFSSYVPPFSSAHMSTAISLLLPHLYRWRSLSIFTDTWAPMYVALQMMQPHITTAGAPLLQSLTLMRCNDFVTCIPTFQPEHMRHPSFLSQSQTHNPLPRLRKLTLRGVHADWVSLATILSQSEYGLDSLDLSSHCTDVRPSFSELNQLLSRCPQLRKLVINGSSPEIPDDAGSVSSTTKDLQPVPLPCLREMTIGYRSLEEAEGILASLQAPNIVSLDLVDATHPGAIDFVDAEDLLTYLTTGTFPEESPSQPPSQQLISLDGDSTLTGKGDSLPKPSLTEVSSITPSTSTKTMFPKLQRLQLHDVKASSWNLYTFLTALPNLRHLEFNNMLIDSLRALVPQVVPETSGPTISCPCPRLQSLCLRNSISRLVASPQTQNPLFLVGALAHERLVVGASKLQQAEIHVGDTRGSVVEHVIRLPKTGIMVKIVNEDPQEDEDDSMDYNPESRLPDPYVKGGAFNDPAFDAHYSSHLTY